ncbi:uncharacterized protein LOC117328515 [Pecten maximus]|uniref:uncharacterized protein LOC117328515 n=1 Tax=Pecten maximus TaxID=6579 RepID=UPI001457F906|nr:uncharacterized protein LOC117328515 [Pecten maximus]
MPCIQIQSYDWITSERERYPILWAAYSGDLAGLQRHLANVKDVAGVNDVQSKTSVLGWAVVGDQVATIKYLVDKYPKLLTLTNKYEASSIFLCSVSGNVDMFKLLAAKGLSPHKRIANLDNVLMLTAARGHLELTRHIVKTYPDMLKQTSKYKIDVFLYSCYSGSIEMFDYMLQLNFDPRVADIDGINCLMIAAYCGHELLLRYILDNASKFSIDITKSDDDGLTALSYSMIRNHTDISQILETYDVKSPGWFRILSSVPLRWLTNSRKEAKPELTIDEYLSLFSGRTEKYRHIRVVFVGPENVGKTTLCLRLQNKDVDISVRRPTLGAELFLQLYEIGWDSKRWTHLHTSRPEEVIHKRLGGMLRNTTVLSDNKGKDNAEKEVVPSVDETSNIAVKSKTEEQTLPEPSTTDTETVRPNLKKVDRDVTSYYYIRVNDMSPD